MPNRPAFIGQPDVRSERRAPLLRASLLTVLLGGTRSPGRNDACFRLRANATLGAHRFAISIECGRPPRNAGTDYFSHAIDDALSGATYGPLIAVEQNAAIRGRASDLAEIVRETGSPGQWTLHVAIAIAHATWRYGL